MGIIYEPSLISRQLKWLIRVNCHKRNFAANDTCSKSSSEMLSFLTVANVLPVPAEQSV